MIRRPPSSTLDLSSAASDVYKRQSQCITYKETSASAYEKIPYDIDILHIDGNHSEEASFFDIVTYYPKVKSGGYIWFDDKNWATTKKAIDYLYENCIYIQMVDNGNCILFQKP